MYSNEYNIWGQAGAKQTIADRLLSFYLCGLQPLTYVREESLPSDGGWKAMLGWRTSDTCVLYGIYSQWDTDTPGPLLKKAFSCLGRNGSQIGSDLCTWKGSWVGQTECERHVQNIRVTGECFQLSWTLQGLECQKRISGSHVYV